MPDRALGACGTKTGRTGIVWWLAERESAALIRSKAKALMRATIPFDVFETSLDLILWIKMRRVDCGLPYIRERGVSAKLG